MHKISMVPIIIILFGGCKSEPEKGGKLSEIPPFWEGYDNLVQGPYLTEYVYPLADEIAENVKFSAEGIRINEQDLKKKGVLEVAVLSEMNRVVGEVVYSNKDDDVGRNGSVGRYGEGRKLQFYFPSDIDQELVKMRVLCRRVDSKKIIVELLVINPRIWRKEVTIHNP